MALEDDLHTYFASQSPAGERHAAARAALVGGELRSDERDALAQALGADELERVRREDEALAAAWDAPEKAAKPWYARLRWPVLIGFAAAVAVLVLAVRPAAQDGDGDDAVRVKGSAPSPRWSLQVGVRRGDEQFVVGPGARLRALDQLGFFYSAAEPGELVIAYVDSSGAVSVLHPLAQPMSAHVAAGDGVRLDAGAVLTPASGCEWVVGVFGRQAFTAESARGEIGRMVAGGDLGPDCRLGPPPDGPRAYQSVLLRRAP